MSDYQSFLESKRIVAHWDGRDCTAADINPLLFDFQRALVAWAVRKGRAAIFADTGLGKTVMQLEWARQIDEKTLIVAPLSVARQTVREASRLDLQVCYSRDGAAPGQITITNYEMIDNFDPGQFGAVVLDESSILKSLNGKTRKQLTQMFAKTPFRLCCTATPAPNDVTELASHSEFLGLLHRRDMLAWFFQHDKGYRNGASSLQGWTLKPYARRPFFRWLASWGMSVRRPSDLGFDDAAYELPPLKIDATWLNYEYVPEGQLFSTGLKGIVDRSRVRKGTLSERCAAAARTVNESTESWIAWVGLNSEEQELHKLIPDAVVLTGSQSPEEKATIIEDFQDGRFRTLISKTSIAGFGVNLQNCHNQVFVGLNDSYESYYQAIRRSYRFGQTKPVNVHVVLTRLEAPILENVWAKEKEAKAMSDELIKEVSGAQLEELAGAVDGGFTYATADVKKDRYHLMLGDSCERLKELPDNSVDLTIASIPFSSIYVYTPDERDLSNSTGMAQFFEHLNYIIDETLRVTKPGRNCCVHVMQLPATKTYHGFTGMIDFHGETIRAFSARGWNLYGEAVIQKNPQVQAIRTKKINLLFKSLNRDSALLAPGIPDYLLIFKKPGENETPITPVQNGEMTEEDWISWAHPIWTDIRETEVLNVRNAQRKEGEKHIAPLQLEVIRRALIMFSNPDETVFDPFGGIGSTGFEAVRNGRKAIMCELKPEYFEVMKLNMADAAQEGHYQLRMFEDDMLTVPEEAA